MSFNLRTYMEHIIFKNFCITNQIKNRISDLLNLSHFLQIDHLSFYWICVFSGVFNNWQILKSYLEFSKFALTLFKFSIKFIKSLLVIGIRGKCLSDRKKGLITEESRNTCTTGAKCSHSDHFSVAKSRKIFSFNFCLLENTYIKLLM